MRPRHLAWRPMRCSTLILGLCTTWISTSSRSVAAQQNAGSRTRHRTASTQMRRGAGAPAGTVGAANRLLGYCVCIHYDADPDRRIADPARAVLVGGHLAPDLIQLSGGAPLFTQPGDTAKWVAFDEIRAAQPDVILQFDCHGCPTARKHPIPRRPGWSELAAVSRHAVYPLSANISDPNLCFPAALEELVGFEHLAAQNPTFKDEVAPHDFCSGGETQYCLATALHYDAVGGRLRQEMHHGPYSAADSVCGPFVLGPGGITASEVATVLDRLIPPHPRICCRVDVGSSSSKSVSIYAHMSSSTGQQRLPLCQCERLSLHANTEIPAHRRDQLERLMRYTARVCRVA